MPASDCHAPLSLHTPLCCHSKKVPPKKVKVNSIPKWTTQMPISDCDPPLPLHTPPRCHPKKVKRKQIPEKNTGKCPQVVTI